MGMLLRRHYEPENFQALEKNVEKEFVQEVKEEDAPKKKAGRPKKK